MAEEIYAERRLVVCRRGLEVMDIETLMTQIEDPVDRALIVSLHFFFNLISPEIQ